MLCLIVQIVKVVVQIQVNVLVVVTMIPCVLRPGDDYEVGVVMF